MPTIEKQDYRPDKWELHVLNAMRQMPHRRFGICCDCGASAYVAGRGPRRMRCADCVDRRLADGGQR